VYVIGYVVRSCMHADAKPINCDRTLSRLFRVRTPFSQCCRYPIRFPEYMTAPAASLVKLPIPSYESAARLGYLGRYSALRRRELAPERASSSAATGTLGLGAMILALGMGVTKIFGVARDKKLLEPLADDPAVPDSVVGW